MGEEDSSSQAGGEDKSVGGDEEMKQALRRVKSVKNWPVHL